MNSTNRREFLRAAAAGLALTGAGAPVLAAQQDGPAGLPTRPLGDTGEKVSIVGLGGWHIGAASSRNEAVSIMHQAIENGMTFFDNAWDYHDGGSEEVMGSSLTADSLCSVWGWAWESHGSRWTRTLCVHFLTRHFSSLCGGLRSENGDRVLPAT